MRWSPTRTRRPGGPFRARAAGGRGSCPSKAIAPCSRRRTGGSSLRSARTAAGAARPRCARGRPAPLGPASRAFEPSRAPAQRDRDPPGLVASRCDDDHQGKERHSPPSAHCDRLYVLVVAEVDRVPECLDGRAGRQPLGEDRERARQQRRRDGAAGGAVPEHDEEEPRRQDRPAPEDDRGQGGERRHRRDLEREDHPRLEDGDIESVQARVDEREDESGADCQRGDEAGPLAQRQAGGIRADLEDRPPVSSTRSRVRFVVPPARRATKREQMGAS
jgi:hypothetical protein